MAATDRKIYFVPLENNPEVMNPLVHNLGLSESLSWSDVYSLDDPDLLAFVPRPAQALMLVFPCKPDDQAAVELANRSMPVQSGSGPEEEVLWFKQTIGNACGLMALLHAACNGSVRESIGPDTPLAHLISQATPMTLAERAKLLETMPDLAAAHASAASRGDTQAPEAEASVDLHFVAFIKSAQNNLWELDGTKHGPINHGPLAPEDDLLSERAIALGPGRFFAKEQATAGGGDMRFSVLSLGPSFT